MIIPPPLHLIALCGLLLNPEGTSKCMHVLVHHCSFNVVPSIKANTQIFSKLVFPSTQQLVNILLLSIYLICLIQHPFQQFFSCHLPSPLEGYNLCLLLRFLSSLAIFAGKIHSPSSKSKGVTSL